MKIIKLAAAIFLINLLLSNNVLGDYPGAFEIPKHLGIIEKSESVSKLPKVIIIKDGHYIYEVQKNIAGILDVLITDYGIGLVGIEGAHGEIDRASFKVNDKIAEKYVKKGILTSIKLMPPGKKFILWGVEDPELFRKNIKAKKAANREELKLVLRSHARKQHGVVGKVKRQIEIIKKMLDLNITRKEWEYYQNNKKYFNIPAVRDADHYYKLVLKRDKVLINNLLKKMNKEKKDTAVLICGGFHVKGIEAELRAKDISYIVISPNANRDLQ